MSDKHTPLPWTEDQDGYYIWAESIGSCNLEMTKHMVAEIRGWGHLRYLGEDIAVDIQKANQELIVRAVNNHEKLVERLNDIVEKLEYFEGAEETVNWSQDILLAKQALSAAIVVFLDGERRGTMATLTFKRLEWVE